MRFELIKENIAKISGFDANQFDICDDTYIKIDNLKFPLTPWRFNRRLLSVKTLAVQDNVLRKVCSYKSSIVGNSSGNLKKVLYSELDTCEWILDDKIVSIYALASGDKALSIILKTKKDILCSIEIALTLSNDTAPVIKHELVGLEGMISDRSINEQIPVEAVYLFEENKKEPVTYTDMDACMFGLDPNEIMVVDNAVALIKNSINIDLAQKNMAWIEYLSDCVFESVNTGEVIKVEGSLV